MTRGSQQAVFTDIVYEKSGNRATITINRPELRNALRTQTFEELTEAFSDAADDPGVGVVVLTGAGEKAFCAGGDANSQKGRNSDSGRAHVRRAAALVTAMRNTLKPVIAAVNGDAVGGGHELQLVCDLVVAVPHARFGQVESRMGSLPMIAGTQYLARLVGERRAREMLFLAKLYSADQALDMGLINAVAAPGELQSVVDAWCDQLLDKSPQGLRNMKVSVNHASDTDFYAAMYGGAELLCMAYNTPEFREGPTAFLEKRKPDFRKFRPEVQA